MNKTFFVSIAIVLLLLLTDCRCRRSQVALRDVIIELPSGINNQSIKDKLKEQTLKALELNPHFVFLANGKSHFELKVSLQPGLEEQNNKALVVVSLENFERIGEPVIVINEMKIKNNFISGSEFDASIKKCLQDIYQFKQNEKIADKTLLEKINDPSADRVTLLNAISILANSNDPVVAEVLIEKLEKTDDIALGNSLMLALGKMKSKEAMNAIIKFAEGKPPIIRRQAIIAARKIGTKEALEWLYVMAYGYGDPLTRKEAQAAMFEIENAIN